MLGSHDAMPGSHDAMPGSHDAMLGSHDAMPGSHVHWQTTHRVTTKFLTLSKVKTVGINRKPDEALRPTKINFQQYGTFKLKAIRMENW